MERKNLNLEFASQQNLNKKSEEILERHSQHLLEIARSTAGDMLATNNCAKLEAVHCNSRQSSFQNLSDVSCKANLSDERFEDAAGQSEELSLNSLDERQSYGQDLYNTVSAKLKAELCKYKNELREYNDTTKDLEEKYLKINNELNEMQEKHDRFLENRKNMENTNDTESYSDSSSSSSSSGGSQFSLKRKYTQVFHRGNSFITMLPAADQQQVAGNYLSQSNLKKISADCVVRQPQHAPASQASKLDFSNTNMHKRHSGGIKNGKQPLKSKPGNKENEPPCAVHGGRKQTAELKDIYKALKTVLDSNHNSRNSKNIDLKHLHATISNLQNEQSQFRNIIKQQQNCLQDYHIRCVKAQRIMETQKIEIEKLNCNNQHLETEITTGIDQLRSKIDTKLKDVAHLPQMVRDEHSRYEKVSKENLILSERLHILQGEAAQLKVKIDDLGRRKMVTINRLKAAERDLKIFKNYNNALKHEKRKLLDELQKAKDQLENAQNASKRSLLRQREQHEKQRRELQKRIFDLELKLNRSQNSTTSLIQERDSLIAELQTQLNTLVHNFEVSQKHIRVLRRHIYSMSSGGGNGGGNTRSNNRLHNETV